MAIDAAGPCPDQGAQEPEQVGHATPLRPRVLWAPREGFDLGPDVSEDLARYREWEVARQSERLGVRRPGAVGTGSLPEVCVLLIVDGPDPNVLRRCLQSLANQTSRNWRLSVTLSGDLDPAAEGVLADGTTHLPAGRVDVHRSLPGEASAHAARAALEQSSSPAFMVMDQGDELAPDAVSLLGAGLVEADVVYGDHDRVDEHGELSEPALKPDWSPELALGWNYVDHPVAFRRAPVESAGGIRPVAVAGDWEHDLLLRVTEATSRVAHVAEVLCHRHGTAPTGATTAPTLDALDRRHEDADVVAGPLPGTWRVQWKSARRPSVSIVVPFRDAPTLLRACVDSVTRTTGDVDVELLLVDNGSEELETMSLLDRIGDHPHTTVLRDPRPFNWAVLNNAAAAHARGEILLFLNNDIEAVHDGWLGILAAQALRPAIGAVGARLLFPSGRVQHAGVVLGMAGAAGHVLVGMTGSRPGYLGMAVLARDCSAVTGACLATRAGVFEQLEGFDESLGLDLNDIDYCLRARSKGLRVMYEPRAELIHHESPSRGTSGSAPDQLRFLDRWEEAVVAGDPFLNRNLTRVECSAALRGPDEEGWWSRWKSHLTR